MKAFSPTPELLEVARRIVWFKKPEETLANPIHFLAYAMRYCTDEDLSDLRKAGIGLAQFSETLDHAPPGVFDPRSWHFWHLKCGRAIVPPLPVRRLDVLEA